MRKFAWIALLGIGFMGETALASTPDLQSGSDGTRGGGEVILVNGSERLRDLVDSSVCDDRTGQELRAANPEVDGILGQLARLDWYFAAGLRWQIDRLEICMTGRLIRVRTRDLDSVILYEPLPTKQAAIRFLNSWDVYVNREIYAKLSGEDRAYLLIHEAMHDFIPIHAERRNEKVRGAVKAIARAVSGEINSVRKLQAALARNFVQYPDSSAKLSDVRPAIEFALGSDADRRAMLLGAVEVELLFTFDSARVITLTLPAHRSDLSETAAERVSMLLEEDLDLQILEKLLNFTPRIQAFDPLLVALSVPGALQRPEYLAAVLRSRAAQTGLSFFDRLGNKKLAVKDGRIVASGGYELLGEPTVPVVGGEVPALSVMPISFQREREMAAEMRGLLRFISQTAGNGIEGWRVLDATIISNNAFYEAFGVRRLRAQLHELQVPIPREKAMLELALPEMIAAFRVVLFKTVAEGAGFGAADRLDKNIDWAQLGFLDQVKN